MNKFELVSQGLAKRMDITETDARGLTQWLIDQGILTSDVPGDLIDARHVERGLLATTDGMVWASEFCRIFNGHLIVAEGTTKIVGTAPTVDEGTMVGWFANAIEKGRSVGRSDLTAEIAALSEEQIRDQFGGQ